MIPASMNNRRRKPPQERGHAVHAAGDGQLEEQELRRQVLQDTASVTSSIAEAIVLKEGDLFFLCEPCGDVPFDEIHGLGLYYHDCRYLDGYELRLADVRPDVLVSTTAYGFMALAQLTIPDILLPDGQLVLKDNLGIRRERVIDSERLVVHDLLTFDNYGLEPIAFPLSLTFRAGFEDVFAVRGMPAARRGRLRPPAWEDGVLQFDYAGSDGVDRRLGVHFSVAPQASENTTAYLQLRVPPRETRRLLVSLAIAESQDGGVHAQAHLEPPDLARVEVFLRRSSDAWLAGETQVRSNSLALNAVIDRSLRDLRVLMSRIADREYFAAGVPWFATLFGRDSLITAIQMLAYDPRIAEQTLRLLAEHQGQREDPWRDEQPGKILHELRVGEMARTGEVPHSPYYGTIDATPLFLVLIAEHAEWTGDLSLFRELRSHVERALEWMTRADLDGDGYLEYQCRSERGLVNQGWKDSGDGIPNSDGTLAQPPIALIEVQGYTYLAKIGLASLFRRAGEPERAAQLAREADELRTRFNQDFWLEDRGCYALALQAGKRPADVISSNPGHALWSGIADQDKARRTVERLMAADMFSGWGVRTLSEHEVRYNPTGYHLGTVWPHDNSLIAAGFHRYGFQEASLQVFDGMVAAATHFPDNRLPELFMGFPRDAYGVPVSYPVACRPQAWAAGAIPYLLQTLLGLAAKGFEHQLRITRPVLPAFAPNIELHGLRVGGSRVDLRFERSARGTVAVDVLKRDGPLEVVMELAPPSD